MVLARYVREVSTSPTALPAASTREASRWVTFAFPVGRSLCTAPPRAAPASVGWAPRMVSSHSSCSAAPAALWGLSGVSRVPRRVWGTARTARVAGRSDRHRLPVLRLAHTLRRPDHRPIRVPLPRRKSNSDRRQAAISRRGSHCANVTNAQLDRSTHVRRCWCSGVGRRYLRSVRMATPRSD